MPEGQETPSIKIRVSGGKKEPTPFENTLSRARKAALTKLTQANSLVGFLMLSNAARELTPPKLNWVLSQDESYAERSAEDWLSDFTGDKDKARFEEEARIVETLLREATLDSTFGNVQVIITKLDKGDFPDYRALAVFPGSNMTDYDLPRVGNASRDIVFMDFNAACNQQAAEMILEGKVVDKFEMSDLTDEQLRQELGFDLSTVQNFRHRDSQGVVTGNRDERLYLLFALKGGFSNETSRYLVSDVPKLSTSDSNGLYNQ